MEINWKHVARDVLIIFALTFVGGFIVGFSSAISGNTTSAAYLGLSNIIFGTLGFAISYLWTTTGRVNHLLAVAGGTWVLSFVNVLFGFGTVGTWIFALIPVLLMAGLGSLVGWGWTSVIGSKEAEHSHKATHNHHKAE